MVNPGGVDPRAARCPRCGTIGLDDLGHVVRCPHCSVELDRRLRPVAPMRSGPPVALLSDDEMPTMVARDDVTELDLADELPTDPRAEESAPAPARFAPPPPSAGAASPFAAPPSHGAFARETRKDGFAWSVGDGGPPRGLDLLVAILVGLDLLSMVVWWRSDAPVAGCYLLPLLGAVLVSYFFWKGRNWARFLLMTGAVGEIVVLGLAFAAVRRHMTIPEMLIGAIRAAVDVYLIWFCVRPDSVAFFERKSGRVGR